MRLRLLFICIFIFCAPKVWANNIYVENFDQLIQSGSQSVSGDTITIINNLVSDESISNSFYTKDVFFQGNNHSINGGDTFGTDSARVLARRRVVFADDQSGRRSFGEPRRGFFEKTAKKPHTFFTFDQWRE